MTCDDIIDRLFGELDGSEVDWINRRLARETMRSVIQPALAEALREAAILLAVLGFLEKVTLRHEVTGRFVASVVCLAAVLLAAGIWLDHRSRK